MTAITNSAELDYLKAKARSFLQANQLDEAASLLREICSKNDSDAEVWCMLGAIDGMLGRLDESISNCRIALSLNPDYPQAWCNLGAAYADLGSWEQAVESYRNALSIEPNYAGALYNLGNVFRAQQRYDDAIEAYRSAISVGGDSPAVHVNLGVVHAARGEYEAAIREYRKAITRDQNFAEAHNGLGSVSAALGRYDQAESAYRTAIACKPTYVEAWSNLGALLVNQDQIHDGIEAYREALRMRPNFADAWNNLGNAELMRGNLSPALDAYRDALTFNPDHAPAQSNLLYALGFDPLRDPRSVTDEHRQWGKRFSQSFKQVPLLFDRNPNRRLRIGYLSSDFREHALRYFIEPVIAHHDSDQFDVYCYSDVINPDHETKRLRQIGKIWRNVMELSDEQLAKTIRADLIDILVDLTGHTSRNRLGVFARKPAPVQINYLGYTQTTGLSTIDYYITDDRADPPGASESLFTESLIRLPDIFCCFGPPSSAPNISPLPAIARNQLTFGSLNSLAKINDLVIDCWARLMERIPDARLLLQAPALSDPQVQTALRTRFKSRGLASHRIEIVGKLSPTDHLELHNQVDVALDAFPWSGHTSLCLTLWMGVPVITLRGKAHPGRKAASILECVGLSEFVANDTDNYVEIAVELATESSRLVKLRQNMRERLLASPLCDAVLYTRNLEQAFRTVWETRCATTE